MRIDFTGRQMDVRPELQAYATKRLKKLTRLLRHDMGVHVVMTAEKHRRIAEITLNYRDHSLVAVKTTRDARTSINGALDKLQRQAIRLLGRRRERKRRPKPSSAVLLNVLSSRRDAVNGQAVLEKDRVPIKPMTVGEAIESLDAAGTGLVVFRNAETERVNVIYRRDDGNLGWIEPEP
jgi:putative sigma-54 modulation protein